MAREVLIDDDLHTPLKVQAAIERATIQGLVSRLVREYLAKMSQGQDSVVSCKEGEYEMDSG
jgi:hypothetical protein